MQLLMLRIASVLAVAFLYMLFDLFNKRNVPGIFAYATLAYGAALTVLYLNTLLILESAAIALVVLSLGYVVYRIGQLGAADVLEFAAISLVLPIQPVPFLLKTQQFGLPFVISVVIAAGIAALVLVPLYYIPKAKSKSGKPLGALIEKEGALKALMMVIPYGVFILFVAFEAGSEVVGIVILLTMMLGSSAMLLFEKPITDSMVELVPVGGCEEGDIVAFNLMKAGEIMTIRKKVKGFDRLLTHRLIGQMKAEHIKGKLPVYKHAVPFAVLIFIGTVLSVLIGNIILLIMPFG